MMHGEEMNLLDMGWRRRRRMAEVQAMGVEPEPEDDSGEGGTDREGRD